MNVISSLIAFCLYATPFTLLAVDKGQPPILDQNAPPISDEKSRMNQDVGQAPSLDSDSGCPRCPNQNRDEPSVRMKASADVLAQKAVSSLRTELGKITDAMDLILQHPTDDAQALCRLRIGLRRSLAALNLYHDLLPEQDARWVKDHLNILRRTTDEMRDDDVIYEIVLDKLGCPNYPFGDFQEKRNTAQEPFINLLILLNQNNLFKNRVAQMLSRVAWPLEKGEEPSFSALAKSKLSVYLQDVFQSLPNQETSFVELHQFRIRIKKVRYTVELLQDLFRSEEYANIYSQLVLLQGVLGNVHDFFNVEQQIKQELNQTTEGESSPFQALLLKDADLLQQEKLNFFKSYTPEVFQKLQDSITTAITPW